MKYLLKFDAWLLDKFQSFSDFISRKTGIGNLNYKIADYNLGLYVIFSVVAEMLFNFSIGGVYSIAVTFSAGIIWRLIAKNDLAKENEFQSKGAIARKPNNPMRVFTRIFFSLLLFIASVLTVLTKAEFFYKFFAIFAWCNYFLFFYFLGCSGLPRQKGRIRQWVRSLFERRELVPVRNK